MARTKYWTQRDLDAYLREHCERGKEYTTNQLLDIIQKLSVMKWPPNVSMNMFVQYTLIRKGWEQIDRLGEVPRGEDSLFYKFN